MPKILTETHVEQFRRGGCVFPIRMMSEAEAFDVRKLKKRWVLEVRLQAIWAA